MKLVGALALTILYVALLLAVYLVHAWYFPVAVVLYAAILDALIATALLALIVIFARRRLPFSSFERLLLVLVWLLGGYAFAISGPTVLDRSLSFYLLEKLAERGGGVTTDAIADIFRHEYLPEYHLVDVRLTEQLRSGTIRIDNGCVRLTDRGWAIAEASRYIRLHLLPKRRILAGRETDALVDPFAGAERGRVGYEC